MACLAQLVNTIAPILTENGGAAWRQTIFYPYLHASLFGRGQVLYERVTSPAYENPTHGSVPYVEAAATCSPADGTGAPAALTLFAVSRHPSDRVTLEGRLVGFEGYELVEHVVLNHKDPKAVNTKAQPNTVVPRRIDGTRAEKGTLNAVLSPLSWNVIRLKAKR